MMGKVPAPEVPLCESIEVVNGFTLSCIVNTCIDVRYLDFLPVCVLQIGDLRTKKMFNLLQFPRPVVSSHVPTETLDVGTTDFMIQGEYFGIPCSKGADAADDPLCAKACTAWTEAGQIGTAAVQTFGEATGVVGDAICYVTSQNDTMVLCSSHTSLRPQRAVPQPDQVWGDITVQKEVDILITVGEALQHVEFLPVMTTLMQCEAGEERIREDEHWCQKCIKGQYSHGTSPQWPLKCSWCEPSEYSDEEGSIECKLCPENTESHLPPDDISRCMCKPGYFSRWVDNADVPTGLPGKECHPCHDELMLMEPTKEQRCGENVPVRKLCDVPGEALVCATPPGVMAFRVCMSACNGGRNWPKAKPGYYLASLATVNPDGTVNIGGDEEEEEDRRRLQEAAPAGEAGNGSREMMPVLVQCDPEVSCAFDNVCGIGYYGDGCVECQPPPLKPYYREKLTNLCQPCGAGQVMGTIIMAAMGVVGTVGAFVGSLFLMKKLSDPNFENLVDRLKSEKIVKPLMKMILSTGLMDANLTKVQVEFKKQDLIPSRLWTTSKDLGIIFRVSAEERRIFVAGVLENTPAHSAGIQRNWRLILVNGIPVKANTEDQVKNLIARQGHPEKLPMRLIFRMKVKRGEEDEDAEDMQENTGNMKDTAKSGMRMLTMSLGVMQCFKGIMSLKMDWPPMFRKVAYIIQQLLLNFDFFHPECSVAMPYWRKWCTFVVMPYCMVFPLAFSASCIKVAFNRHHRKDRDFAKLQDWMLKNALMRTILVTMLLFVNFHLGQLIEAFSCVEREEGVMVLANAQSVPCTWNNEEDPADPTYKIVFTFSFVGWFVVCGGFSWLGLVLWWGYKWQAGCKVRDVLPWYVALTEVSVGGMNGYEEPVRERVMANIVAVKFFPTYLDLMKFREQLTVAITFLGPRSREVQKEDVIDEQGEEKEDSIEKRKYILACKDRWIESKNQWEEDLHGNIICYGWILVINTFVRQVSLMLTVVFSTSFPPFGAAGQSLIFIINFLAVCANRPYASDLLNFQEALLMACMAALTFLATFKELLEGHNRANDYPLTVLMTAKLIDALVVCILITIFSVMGFNFFKIASNALAQEDNANMLNCVHFDRIMARKEIEGKAEETMMEQIFDSEKDSRLGAQVWDEIRKMEEKCSVEQWAQFRHGANILLGLYDMVTLPESERKGEGPRIKMKMLEAGLRPTHLAVKRRRGSGIFTDMFARALDEQVEKVPDLTEAGGQNESFQNLAAMIVAETEKEVGRKQLVKKMKIAEKQAENRTEEKEGGLDLERLLRETVDASAADVDRSKIEDKTRWASDDIGQLSFMPDEARVGSQGNWNLSSRPAPMALGGIHLNTHDHHQVVQENLNHENYVNRWDDVGPAQGVGEVPDLEIAPVDRKDVGQVVESWDDVGPTKTHYQEVGHMVSKWDELGPVSEQAVEEVRHLPPVAPSEESKNPATNSVLEDTVGQVVTDWGSIGPMSTTANAKDYLQNVVPVRGFKDGPTVDDWSELGPVTEEGPKIANWEDLGPVNADAFDALPSDHEQPKQHLTPLPQQAVGLQVQPEVYDWNDLENTLQDWGEKGKPEPPKPKPKTEPHGNRRSLPTNPEGNEPSYANESGTDLGTLPHHPDAGHMVADLSELGPAPWTYHPELGHMVVDMSELGPAEEKGKLAVPSEKKKRWSKRGSASDSNVREPLLAAAAGVEESPQITSWDDLGPVTAGPTADFSSSKPLPPVPQPTLGGSHEAGLGLEFGPTIGNWDELGPTTASSSSGDRSKLGTAPGTAAGSSGGDREKRNSSRRSVGTNEASSSPGPGAKKPRSSALSLPSSSSGSSGRRSRTSETRETRRKSNLSASAATSSSMPDQKEVAPRKSINASLSAVESGAQERRRPSANTGQPKSSSTTAPRKLINSRLQAFNSADTESDDDLHF